MYTIIIIENAVILRSFVDKTNFVQWQEVGVTQLLSKPQQQKVIKRSFFLDQLVRYSTSSIV